jgi:hypothetical protein
MADLGYGAGTEYINEQVVTPTYATKSRELFNFVSNFLPIGEPGVKQFQVLLDELAELHQTEVDA